MKDRAYIAVAGNIGAGKSSFVEWLGARYDVDVLPEPNEANPFLQLFYDDMKRWAFHSQMFFLSQKIAVQQTIEHAERPIIQDRCIWEDAEIFAGHLAQSGVMSADEYRTYRDIFDTMANHLRKPDLLIYLRCPVPTLRKRIKQRGRSMEKGLKVRYLTDLHDLYERWVADWTLSPALVIPTDRVDPVSHLFDHAETLALMDKYLLRRDLQSHSP
jgi:deoxyadenosine/deoxycytidine kinase